MGYNPITADILALALTPGAQPPKAPAHTHWAAANEGKDLPIKKYYTQWKGFNCFSDLDTLSLKSPEDIAFAKDTFEKYGLDLRVLSLSTGPVYNAKGKTIRDHKIFATAEVNQFNSGIATPTVDGSQMADILLHCNAPKDEVGTIVFDNKGVYISQAKTAYAPLQNRERVQPLASTRLDFCQINRPRGWYYAVVRSTLEGSHSLVTYNDPNAKLYIKLDSTGKNKVELAKDSGNYDITMEEERLLPKSRPRIFIKPSMLSNIKVSDGPKTYQFLNGQGIYSHQREINFGPEDKRIKLTLTLKQEGNKAIAQNHGFDLILRESESGPGSIVPFDCADKPLLTADELKKALQNLPPAVTIEEEKKPAAMVIPPTIPVGKTTSTTLKAATRPR